MKPVRVFASVISVISVALACPAYSLESDSGKAPAHEPRSTSPATDIKHAFVGIGHGIRDGARQFKAGVKDGAHKFKRSVAVARCNNGEYSYTHHATCNHNGGVRERLR